MTARDIVMSAAGNAGAGKTYIEDVFSTYLYTGNGSTQTITNGIDLAGNGGMVWCKTRSANAWPNSLFDTARGVSSRLISESTSAASNTTNGVTAFNSNGFSLGDNAYSNYSGDSNVSWTFRKAPKFFDVVTYTGTGSARTIAHSLGQEPGMIIVKSTSGVSNWNVYHRSQTNGGGTAQNSVIYMNLTNAGASAPTFWNNTAPTSSVFTLGDSVTVNGSGVTYVAYLFAHDTTTDGLIQCGSFTTDASGNATVNLGWEPQYALMKSSSSSGTWIINDTMRGADATGTTAPALFADTSAAESTNARSMHPNATGFVGTGVASTTYIYMAIRRGPMRTPTDGTKVFSTKLLTGNATNRSITSLGFTPDCLINKARNAQQNSFVFDRLRGSNAALYTTQALAEAVTTSNKLTSFDMDGFTVGTDALNSTEYLYANWLFKRAPGFFDVVCYTTPGSTFQTIYHNLGVVPELIIVKQRNSSNDWGVQYVPAGNNSALYLNTSDGFGVGGWSYYFNNITSTSMIERTSVSGYAAGNYVAYLFASCPGVSKVGSYTGNGSSQTINCGFSAGARFVLIKRTNSTGDWYVWDTARGIVAGTDPHLSLNTTAAEVTTDDTIDSDSTGFIVNQVSATNVNVNAATYIYLAIA